MEIVRVLKPGGLFICYHLPNRYSWIETALRLSGRWGHQCRYTTDGIKSLLKNTGFSVLEAKRYTFLPRNVWSWGSAETAKSDSRIAGIYDRLDGILSKTVPVICQSHLFVAEKRGCSTNGFHAHVCR